MSPVMAQAQSDIYESYAILSTNGATNVYYDLQASTGNPDFQGADLGTFFSGNTLVLNGAQNKVYKCNTDDVTSGNLFYRIYEASATPPAFNSTPIFYNSDNGTALCGGINQVWESSGANINVLNGLAAGNYVLELYTNADFTYASGSGTHYANNGGANYKGFFTLSADCVTGVSLSPSSPQSVCLNAASGQLTASITTVSNFGAGNITYNWYSNTTNSTSGGTLVQTTNTTTATTTDTYTPPSTATGTLYYYVEVLNADAACTASVKSATVQVTVNPLVTPTVSIAANPGNSICAGTTVTFTATLVNGGTSPGYQWQISDDGVSWNNIPGETTSTYSSAALTQGQRVRVIMTPDPATIPCLATATSTSNAVTMTVNDLLVPSVTIAASPGMPVCAGASVTFTAGAPINGGTSPSYQWQVNGINAGTNAPAYTTNSLSAGDVVSLLLTSNAVCASPATVTSANTVTISIKPDASLSLTSAAGTDGQTKCINTALTNITYAVGGSGTGASVTGLPAGVSGSYSGGVFTISGTPSASGTFNYTVTTSGTCAQTTAGGTITVSPNASIALSGGNNNQTVCINTVIGGISFTVGGTGTGASVSGLPAGVSGNYSGGVLTISGSPTASGTFNYTVTATGTCGNATTSGTLTVTPDASLSLTSAAGTDNQTKCINTTLTNITYAVGGSGTGASVTGLPAGVSGSYSGGVFTISGTPSASGTFNYTVTTSGTCAQTTAGGTITVSPNASITLSGGNNNQMVCINTAIGGISFTVGGTGTGASASGLPAGVSGSYSGGVFTISGSPTASGTFNYTVTATGTCGNATTNGTLTVTPDATLSLTSAAATINQTKCLNSALTAITYAIGGSGTGATVTGLPSGVTGAYNSGTKVFTISGAPTTGGTFNYTVTTSGPCGNVSLTGTIKADIAITAGSVPTPVAAAGQASSICPPATGLVYSITAVPNATSYTWNVPASGWTITSGQGTLSITATAVAQATGSKNITVTATNSCGSITSSPITMTVGTFPDVNAGADAFVCSGTGTYQLAATSAATSATNLNNDLTWSATTAGGSFSNNKANAVYTIPVAIRTGGTVSIIATVNGEGTCPVLKDTMVLTILPAPTAAISGTTTICSGSSTNITFTGTANTTVTYKVGAGTNQTLNLGAGGSASISTGALAATTVYTLVSVAHNSNSSCTASINTTATVTVNNPATVTPGATLTTCQSSSPSPVTLTGASVGGAATTGAWSVTSGGGSLSSTAQTATPNTVTYTPAANASGNITLTLLSNAPGACPAVSATRTITINPTATANAGTAQTVCAGGSITLGGSIGGSATSGTWSAPSGSFSNTASLTSTYTPSISSGSVVLTLTSNDPDGAGPCVAAVSTVTITVNPAATSNAGAAQTVCAGSSINLSGTVGGSATSGTWSAPSGIFSDASSLTSQYTPSVSSGTVILTLTSNDPDEAGPCPGAASAVTITVNPIATVNAGATQTVCAGGSITLAGSIGGSATTGTWSAPSGSFSNASSLTPTYTPSISSGNVVLTLTSNDPDGAGPCVAATSTVTITVNPVATVSAGSAQTVCSNSFATMNGAIGGSAGSATWSTSGNGSFNNNTPSAIYTPGSSDIAAGTVTLTYTTDDPAGPCSATASSVLLTIKKVPQITTQPSNTSICATNPVSLTVVAVGDNLSYQWYKGSIPGVAVSNSANISGANSPVLHFTQASLGDDGNYYVVVTGDAACTAATSSVRSLAVDQSISIITQPSGQTVCENATNTTFTVAANAGGDPLTYQWRFNNVNIPGAMGTSYTIPTATLATAGDYDVVITGPSGYTCSTANSAKATLTVTPTVSTPVFAAGAASSICQAQAPVSYTATAANSTGITYSLDATSAAAGNTINASGNVTWDAGWSGTTTITATAAGCGGPKTASHTVTVTPTVATPAAISIAAGAEPVCQLTNGTTTTGYATTAANSTGFNWSLSNPAAGSINPATGVVTWANGFSGSTDIRVTANGCNGPSATISRTVNITPTVGTPTAITGTPPACQIINGTTTTTFSTTSTNNTGLNWSLSDPAAGTIDAGGTLTWNNGYSGTVSVMVTANGCNGPSAVVSRPVMVAPSVTSPVFAAGSTSTRCQGAGSVTYSATATNTTGITYSLDATSAAYAGNSINSSTGAVTYSPGWSGTSTITASAAGCNGPLTATHTVTITPISTGGTISPNVASACANTNTGTLTLSGNNAPVLRWEYSQDGGATWTTVANTTNSLTFNNIAQTRLYRAVVQGSPCALAYSSNAVVTVMPPFPPSPAVATPATICAGQSSTLSTTAGTPAVGIGDSAGNFNNANPTGWRKDGISSGSFLPAASDNTNPSVWLESNSHTFGTINYNTIDGKFAIANGTFTSTPPLPPNTTTLETPVFSLVGQTNGVLSFLQSYLLNGSANVKVELSTNGGASYSNVLENVTGPASYGISGNVGTLIPATMDLSNYLGLSNLRIKFTFTGTAGSAWLLDNIIVPAAALNVSYTWATPATLNTTSGTSVIATPPVTTTYTVTTTINGCPGGSQPVTVTVNPVPVITPSVTSATVCSGSALTPVTFSSTVSPTAYGFAISNPGGISGLTTNTATGTISGTPVNSTNSQQTITFTVTPTATGAMPNCPGTPVTVSITVNPNIPVTLSGGGTICGSVTAPLTLTSPGPFPVDVTLSDGITYTLNSSPTVINVAPASTTTYSITGLSGTNCASIAGSGTATVTVLSTSGPVGTWLCGAGDGDWFNPCNWGGGVVPTNNIDVIISAAAACSPVIDPNSPYAPADRIARSRSLTIDAGQNVSFAAGTTGELDVAGDWVNNAGPAGFTANTGTVAFTGSTAQTIKTTGTNTETFYNMVVNNTSGLNNAVTLLNPVDVAGVLDLTNGIVVTATDKLLSVINPAVNAVTGGSNASYVWGPIARNTNTTADYVYPVGNPAGPYGPYRPAITTPQSTDPATYQAAYNVNTITPPDVDLTYHGSFLSGILATEHWQIDRPAGTTDAVIKLPYVYPPSSSDWDGGIAPNLCACSIAIVTPYSGLWDFTGGPAYTGGYTPNESIYYGTNNTLFTKPMSQFGDFTFGFGFTIILPVKLVSFEGTTINNDGKLSWQVENGKDLALFELEYSRDGSHFSRLATIPGKDGQGAYSYLHRNLPAGLNYYRLRVKEKSGNTFTSKTILLLSGRDITLIRGIKPTMVQNETFVEIHSVSAQTARSKLLDASGRTVAEYRNQLEKGENRFSVNAQMLAQGLYTLYIETADGVKATYRFVKE